MTTVKFTIGKQVFDVPANDSREMSDHNGGKIPDAVIKYCQAAQRVGNTSKGKPIIKDDSGKRFVIGCKTLCKDDEKLCSGVGSGPVLSDSFWETCAKLMSNFDEADQKTIAAQCPEVAAKMDLAKKYGLSLEDLEAVLEKTAAKKTK